MAVQWLLSGSSMVAQWLFDGGLMVVQWHTFRNKNLLAEKQRLDQRL